MYKMDVLKSNNTAQNHQTRANNEQTWQARMHGWAVEFAGTFIGQAVMMQSDKLLWTLEKSATWISNGKTDVRRTKAPVNLVRPLPWIFFLPTLVALRFVRVVLSLVAISFGFDEIESTTMVSYMHQWRRNLRQIRQEANRKTNRPVHSIERAILSLRSYLSNWIPHTPNAVQAHNKKTSLDVDTGETAQRHVNNAPASSDDDSDSETKLYKEFIAGDIETSDSDDDDFSCEFDSLSDIDSGTSIASDDLSDVDAKPFKAQKGNGKDSSSEHDDDIAENGHSKKNSRAENTGDKKPMASKAADAVNFDKGTNGNMHDDSNHSTATSITSGDTVVFLSNESEKGNTGDAVNADSSSIADSSKGAKAVGQNRAKKPNQSYSKTNRPSGHGQNNGKPYNGSQVKPKPSNAQSSNDFIGDATSQRT